MIYKERTEPEDLVLMRILNARMELPTKSKQYYYRLEKGYQGELAFDQQIEKLECDRLVLNGLLFEVNNTTFQIDSLIITADILFSFEIKNNEGDYYYESDKLFLLNSKKEVANPLTQLTRAESLFRQLMKEYNCTIPIHASVVFINPSFTLYQCPTDLPFVLPTQIDRLMKKLNNMQSKLTGHHKWLADQLIARHITKYESGKIPPFNYEDLEKGIMCKQCYSLSTFVGSRKCVCEKCGFEEPVDSAIFRSTEEFKLLFPDQKITTNQIFDWCRVVPSKRKIRDVLKKRYNIRGVHQWAYYE